jgi:multisubunit Na+/H+ antiporter MnhB subunit
MNRTTAIPAPLSKLPHLTLGLLLVWMVWNFVELTALLYWSGVVANSIALLGYGLDSLIELFAGIVLIWWRLGTEWKDEREGRDSDRKALMVVGLTFLALSASILFHAVWFPQSKESVVAALAGGKGLVLASALVMTVLYFWKTSILKKIGSRAFDLQDLTVLVGLGANIILVLWWADPFAAVLALVLIPELLKKGREAFSGEEEDVAENP